MDAKTLEALKGSIAKWEAIVAGTGVDQGCDNCPLCLAFPGGDCTNPEGGKCPVAVSTGKNDCYGTPFYDFCKAAEWDEFLDGSVVGNSEAAHAAAQAELDFLKSLLPEGESA
jgi:hypothetical protein